jgi:short-subunit dehydrogenase
MGKKIIIVGATSGIGREMALYFLKQGHQVGITGRRQQLLQEIKNRYPQQTFIESFDVRDANVTIYLDKLNLAMNGFDLLIYNAGVGHPSKELDAAKELETTLINVNGFVAIADYAFNYFRKRGYGQLVVISSVAGLTGSSMAPAYSASKAFISNYAEGLQMKAYALKANIIVTDIRPGFINTKEAAGYKRFWAASPQKAAAQIIHAIGRKKRVAYITKRWWLIAILLKVSPYWLYKRFL